MNKFGVRNPFDLKIYGEEGLLFHIDTAKEVSITRNFGNNTNELTVEDALVDIKVLNDVLNGKYDRKHLRISGVSVFRGLDCLDRDVELKVTVAKLVGYSLPIGIEPSIVSLTFAFPTKDAYGFKNAVLEIR